MLKRTWYYLLTILILIGALIVPIIIGRKYPDAEYWNGLGGLGSYITGLVAAIAALTAVPEWIQFRRNKQNEKVEEALVAAKRFINAIFQISNPFSTSQAANDPDNKTKPIIIERQERMRVVLADAENLFKVSSEADLYLTDEQISIIDRLIEIWNEVQTNFRIYIFNLNNDVRGADSINAWEKAFVQGDLKKELIETQEKIKKMMKSLRDSAN